MSAPHTEHRGPARRMLDRFAGGQPKPPSRLGKAWSIAIFFLAPVFVYYVFAGDAPLPWTLPILCFVLAGVAGALARLSYRRRRLAYALNAVGALVFQVGMIAFIVVLGMRGEWGFFGYALFVYGVLILLAVSGTFDPDSSIRDGQQEGRS